MRYLKVWVASAALLIGCGGSDSTVSIETGFEELGFRIEDCPPGYNVIVGTPANDTIIGTEGNDCIFGKRGSDFIDGRGGDDWIRGGRGNDRILGGIGVNRIHGGRGNDILHGASYIDVFPSRGGDEIYGGPGNDVLVGSPRADDLIGGKGGDSIFGNGGNDTIRGGPGADSLFGESGVDILVSDEEDLSVNGGEDDDFCDGENCEIPSSQVISCREDAECPSGGECTGARVCDVNQSTCFAKECANDTVCVEEDRWYTCDCRGVYEGALCERPVDQCKEGGSCSLEVELSCKHVSDGEDTRYRVIQTLSLTPTKPLLAGAKVPFRVRSEFNGLRFTQVGLTRLIGVNLELRAFDGFDHLSQPVYPRRIRPQQERIGSIYGDSYALPEVLIEGRIGADIDELSLSLDADDTVRFSLGGLVGVGGLFVSFSAIECDVIKSSEIRWPVEN